MPIKTLKFGGLFILLSAGLFLGFAASAAEGDPCPTFECAPDQQIGCWTVLDGEGTNVTDTRCLTCSADGICAWYNACSGVPSCLYYNWPTGNTRCNPVTNCVEEEYSEGGRCNPGGEGGTVECLFGWRPIMEEAPPHATQGIKEFFASLLGGSPLASSQVAQATCQSCTPQHCEGDILVDDSSGNGVDCTQLTCPTEITCEGNTSKTKTGVGFCDDTDPSNAHCACNWSYAYDQCQGDLGPWPGPNAYCCSVAGASENTHNICETVKTEYCAANEEQADDPGNLDECAVGQCCEKLSKRVVGACNYGCTPGAFHCSGNKVVQDMNCSEGCKDGACGGSSQTQVVAVDCGTAQDVVVEYCSPSADGPGTMCTMTTHYSGACTGASCDEPTVELTCSGPCPTQHAECVNDFCQLVDGAGDNTCGPDLPPCAEPASHTECLQAFFSGNWICASAAGGGTDECDPTVGCPLGDMHTECDFSLGVCKSVPGAGVDSCYDDQGNLLCKESHTECEQKTGETNCCTQWNDLGNVCLTWGKCPYLFPPMCVTKPGAGGVGCQSDWDCAIECPVCAGYGRCETQKVAGGSCDYISNSCGSNDECSYHSECSAGGACVVVPGGTFADDTCDFNNDAIGTCCGRMTIGPDGAFYCLEPCNSDCLGGPPPPPTGSVCNAKNQCVPGPEGSNCVCGAHNECVDNVCQPVPGAGDNQCGSTCGDKHSFCGADEKCHWADGPGDVLCGVPGKDCPSGPPDDPDGDYSNTACVGSQCKTYFTSSGPGINGCGSDSECATTPKHNECNPANQCVSVDGEGQNACFSHDECAGGSHNECDTATQKCVTIPGEAIDFCASDAQCEPPNEYHSYCAGETCLIADGPGINECYSFEDCENGKHRECSSDDKCVVADGEGEDQCNSDSNCPAHTVCNPLAKTCEVVQGEGIDQCQSGENCQTDKHNACAPNSYGEMTCEVFEGAGDDQCQTSAGCQHTECNNDTGQCVTVAGPGENQCSSNSDCPKHNVCGESQCEVVDGAGDNECQLAGDCKHTECMGQYCITVAGGGDNECQSNDSCVHNECDNDAGVCEMKAGPGENQCTANSDCPKHNVCTGNTDQGNFMCETVNGPGENMCQIDGDCPKHTECVAGLCAIVPGAGINQCDLPGGFSPFPVSCPTHTICDPEDTEPACVVVPGEGLDECKKDSDCLLVHTECAAFHNECTYHAVEGPGGVNTFVNDGCNVVEGEGENQCAQESDCNEGHIACVNFECVTVSGPGLNQCSEEGEPCSQGRHNECGGIYDQQCVVKDGPGPDTCFNDTDCPPGRIELDNCDFKKCMQVAGLGINQCQTDIQCITGVHNQCQTDPVTGGWTCAVLNECGINTCAQTEDCYGEFHNECVFNQGFGWACEQKPGLSLQSECIDNSDCIPTSCNAYGQCVIGGGGEECDITPDNPNPCTHKGCSPDGQCVSGVPGGGDDECMSEAECTHTECQGTQCVSVPPGGENLCDPITRPCLPKCIDLGGGDLSCEGGGGGADENCSPGQVCDPKHAECVDNECVAVDGEGDDLCDTVVFACSAEGRCEQEVQECGDIKISNCMDDNDCSRTDCVLQNNSYVCQQVNAPGINDPSCDGVSLGEPCADIPPFYYNACVHTDSSGWQCVPQESSSPKPDECQSSEDCHMHSDCVGSSCQLVEDTPGNTDDTCVEDTECTHTECQGTQCVSVPPGGENLCDPITRPCLPKCIDLGGGDLSCEGGGGGADENCSPGQVCDDGPKHAECDASDQCVAVDGEGDDLCDTPRFICTTQGTCEQTDECGESDCMDDNDCSHTDCVDGVCAIINTRGADDVGCVGKSAGDECVSHYNACVNDDGITKCVSQRTSEPREDECEIPEDCTMHNECIDGACAQVPDTPGNTDDTCVEDTDCRHNECSGAICIQAPNNPFSNFDTCGQLAPCVPHNECIDNVCELVDELGNSEDCDIGEACQPQHGECDPGTDECVLVDGEGRNQCYTNFPHLVCNGGRCEESDICGLPECLSHADCQHVDCVGDSCQVVYEPGTDDRQCASKESGAMCNEELTYNACVYEEGTDSHKCVSQNTDEPREDECQTLKDCVSHWVCQGEACVEVEGKGCDMCFSNEECTEQVHAECAAGECTMVPGLGCMKCIGNDFCEEDDDTHWECAGQECLEVDGPGCDKCSTNDQCINNVHNECDFENEACVEVEGEGCDECSDTRPCPTEGGCAVFEFEFGSASFCIPGFLGETCGSPFSECGETDGNKHTECVSLFSELADICVEVDGEGDDECNLEGTWCDAPNTYGVCEDNGLGGMVCQQYLGNGTQQSECENADDCWTSVPDNACQGCVMAPGSGCAQCNQNTDCQHNACIAGLCISIEGEGPDECELGSEFCLPMRSMCLGRQCVAVYDNEELPDQCSVHEECYHNECNPAGQCVTVDGPGQNCYSECDPSAPNSCVHNECVNQTCMQVLEPGQDECQENYECAHNECVGSRCLQAPFAGIDQCFGETCEEPKHNECDGTQCFVADGEGWDECQTSRDCKIKHYECDNAQQKCVKKEGFGDNQCDGDADCASGKHYECNNSGQCQVADGEGENECRLDRDCVSPPYAESQQAVSGDYCTGIPGTGVVSFQWVYENSAGAPEKKFWLQVDDNSNFSSPEVSRILNNLDFAPGTLNQQSVLVKTIDTEPGCDYIKYGVNYYWRVMMWESFQNLDSGWITASEPFKQSGYPAPYPEFTWLPQEPEPNPNQQILFRDLSVCFNAQGPYACRTSSVATYLWDFGDGDTSEIKGDLTNSYTGAGIYDVDLRVCDGGVCCDMIHQLPVRSGEGQGLPKWKEISPF